MKEASVRFRDSQPLRWGVSFLLVGPVVGLVPFLIYAVRVKEFGPIDIWAMLAFLALCGLVGSGVSLVCIGVATTLVRRCRMGRQGRSHLMDR